MTTLPPNIPGVFELHQKNEVPTKRLLIVFSAANASKFTFFKSTEGMCPDRLYIRDPEGNAWYQNGLAEGETLDALEARIAQVVKSYKSVWMLGSSMGGYAALYFGCRLGVERVLAIAPQIVLDSRFSRGPRQDVKIQTASIAELVRTSRRTQCTIVFGSFDLVDTYNISQLYVADDMPVHVRVLQYEGQDHMLPVYLEEECTLMHYFQMVLGKNTVPQISLAYTEGRPLDSERLEVMTRYIEQFMVKKDHLGAYTEMASDCERFPDWHALHYYRLMSGYRAKVPPQELWEDACRLSDLHPKAIDFAFLAAQCSEDLGDHERARIYLNRVFSIRRSHPGGRKMQVRFDSLTKHY